MYLIALLLALAASAQTPPPDEPESLKPGEATYEVELHDGKFIYVIAKTGDFNERTGRGNFYVDQPDAVSGKIPYEFKKIWPESPENRRKRWKEMVASWHEAANNVQVDAADGSKVWVKEAVAQRSNRAREAALKVMHDREERERIDVDANSAMPNQAESTAKPGLIQVWGPQAAVVILGLMLMAIAARVFIFNGESGWEKIE